MITIIIILFLKNIYDDRTSVKVSQGSQQVGFLFLKHILKL
jgi:hypothetical protein